jgi:predicted ester cyclase
MSSQDNIHAVRRLLTEGFGGGDLKVVDDYVAADFEEHQNGAQGHGPEAVKRVITGLHDSLSEMHMDIQSIVADGDIVWTRVRAQGVNTKPIMGRPATGKSMAIDVIDVIRFSDGKMVEHWGVADRLGMLQQLGLLPLPPGRSASG